MIQLITIDHSNETDKLHLIHKRVYFNAMWQKQQWETAAFVSHYTTTIWKKNTLLEDSVFGFLCAVRSASADEQEENQKRRLRNDSAPEHHKQFHSLSSFTWHSGTTLSNTQLQWLKQTCLKVRVNIYSESHSTWWEKLCGLHCIWASLLEK